MPPFHGWNIADTALKLRVYPINNSIMVQKQKVDSNNGQVTPYRQYSSHVKRRLMAKKGSTKILSHYSEYALSSTVSSIYSTLIAIKGLYSCFPMPLLTFIYCLMGLLICKYEPFCQEASGVSDTQVTVKAGGPLVWVFKPIAFLSFILTFTSIFNCLEILFSFC